MELYLLGFLKQPHAASAVLCVHAQPEQCSILVLISPPTHLQFGIILAQDSGQL